MRAGPGALPRHWRGPGGGTDNRDAPASAALDPYCVAAGYRGNAALLLCRCDSAGPGSGWFPAGHGDFARRPHFGPDESGWSDLDQYPAADHYTVARAAAGFPYAAARWNAGDSWSVCDSAADLDAAAAYGHVDAASYGDRLFLYQYPGPDGDVHVYLDSDGSDHHEYASVDGDDRVANRNFATYRDSDSHGDFQCADGDDRAATHADPGRTGPVTGRYGTGRAGCGYCA